MAIAFAVLKKEGAEQFPEFPEVEAIAAQLRDHLNEDGIQKRLRECHVLGASSADIQNILLEKAHQLGFESEAKGRFSTYEASALRPDYFRSVGDAKANKGILLEVERGKTIPNNMDLLDLWKCHICQHANHLFLVVPQVRPTQKGRGTGQFSHVLKRLAPFFEARNYVNVDAVFLFGY